MFDTGLSGSIGLRKLAFFKSRGIAMNLLWNRNRQAIKKDSLQFDISESKKHLHWAEDSLEHGRFRGDIVE